jgi:hypothetical protein
MYSRNGWYCIVVDARPPLLRWLSRSSLNCPVQHALLLSPLMLDDLLAPAVRG